MLSVSCISLIPFYTAHPLLYPAYPVHALIYDPLYSLYSLYRKDYPLSLYTERGSALYPLDQDIPYPCIPLSIPCSLMYTGSGCIPLLFIFQPIPTIPCYALSLDIPTKTIPTRFIPLPLKKLFSKCHSIF